MKITPAYYQHGLKFITEDGKSGMKTGRDGEFAGRRDDTPVAADDCNATISGGEAGSPE